MNTYRLYSSSQIWMPGMLAVMMQAYENEKDRQYIRAIFRKTWAIPAKLAHRLLTGTQAYTIDDNDDILITV